MTKGFDVVVGVGASAGGLEALERFLANLSPATTKTFIVAQHLSPEHKSMMVPLLAKRTPLSVVEAHDDAPLAAQTVYLVPPHANVVVTEDRLRLMPRATTSLNLPVDELFKSIAEKFGARSMGVVLSGTGSDGRDGVIAIKGAGGVVLVQDPATARFDGMPREALRTGLVDAVLSPEDIATELEKVGPDHMLLARLGVSPDATAGVMDALGGALRSAVDFDVASYKPGTVMRRMDRRMRALGLADLASYVEHVRSSPDEAKRLVSEILIHVTEFFRDSDVFEHLANEQLPGLVARAAREPLRIWVAGCATGEEAYSLAIVLLERGLDFRIFATDIDTAAIGRAGAGIYGEAAVAGVPPAQLERYFVKRDGGYEVTRELRRRVVFTTHDLLKDPPFINVDLVSCRNLLIYLTAAAQRRVVDAFAFALKPGGLLVLGPSELPGHRLDELVPVDNERKFFVRRGGRVHAGVVVLSPRRHRRETVSPSQDDQANVAAIHVLTNKLCRAAVLVTDTMRLVRVFGNAGKLLSLGLGEPSFDLPSLLSEPLRAATNVAVHRAFATSEETSFLVSDAMTEVAFVRAIPFSLHVGSERYAVVVFEPRPAESSIPASGEILEKTSTLERELAVARQSLQTAIEELETSNEELQAMNEELVASNEELQSTNEELQSVNEELHTVNAENQERIVELERTNADLDNLLDATPVATIFLDEKLSVRRFNSAVSPLFSLVTGDEGRPLTHFTSTLVETPLAEELAQVVSSTRPLQREIATRSGGQYLLRAVPHLLPGKHVAGAVLTFADVTSLHASERARDELQELIDAQPTHIAVIDERGVIELVNDAWKDFGQANGGTQTSIGTSYLAAAAPDPPVVAGLLSVIRGESPLFRHVYGCAGARFLMLAKRTQNGRRVVVSHTEVTDLEETEAAS